MGNARQVGNRIRHQRVQRKLTIPEVAARVLATPETIEALEAGRLSTVDARLIDSLATLFGYSTDNLLYGWRAKPLRVVNDAPNLNQMPFHIPTPFVSQRPATYADVR